MKNLLVRMWTAFTTYQERRAMYIMLNTMSAKQLRDLGLNREEFLKRFGD